MYGIGSSASGTVDRVFIFIVLISVALLLIITGLMIFFIIRYNRKRHPRPKPIEDKPLLEIIWTVIPTVLVLAMFYYGYQGFSSLRNVPDNALTVHVTGRMWDWSFEYENGITSSELHVPVNQPIKLVLKSLDVIHSFYIPKYRIKEDVLPDQETYLWFKPQTTGPADIFCAEYCGERHAFMLSRVNVMTADAFAEWYEGQTETGERPEDPPSHPGRTLLIENGCMECHTFETSGTELVIPLGALFGEPRRVIVDGVEKTVTADSKYLTRAIRTPGYEVLEGYTDSMPAFDNLSDEEIAVIIAYLKQLK